MLCLLERKVVRFQQAANENRPTAAAAAAQDTRQGIATCLTPVATDHSKRRICLNTSGLLNQNDLISLEFVWPNQSVVSLAPLAFYGFSITAFG